MSEWTDTRGRPLERPWCCPEPRCTPLFQAFDSSAKPLGTPQPGQSWSCWGKLTEPVTFVYNGVEHANDLKSCWQSALKGVISWQENRDDWVWNEYGYREALARLDAIKARAGTPGGDE